MKVTVTLGDVSKVAVANELQQWSVNFSPMKASIKPIQLKVESSHGHKKHVKNILVGDVWYLTGSTLLTSELAFNSRDPNKTAPSALPLVREFRRKTKASTFPTPRKRKFETGGGRYRSSWITADFSQPDKTVSMFAYHFTKTLGRKDVPQGFITMSSGHGGRNGQMASPLSWTSFEGVKNVTNHAFRDRLNQLFLQFPNTKVAQKALEDHIGDVKAFVQQIVDAKAKNGDLSKQAPLSAPTFPEAGKGSEVRADTIPTYAYNWCVSPMTPMAVAGVLWIPSENNVGYSTKHYASELEIYAKSIDTTYGSKDVQFIYAHPGNSLLPGVAVPEIPGAKRIPFSLWPKSLQDVAIQMAKIAD